MAPTKTDTSGMIPATLDSGVYRTLGSKVKALWTHKFDPCVEGCGALLSHRVKPRIPKEPETRNLKLDGLKFSCEI